MRKRLKAIFLLIFITSYQQFSFAQEVLKREKIYTLTSNEVVAYEENSLGLYQDELGYIVVTADVKKFSRNYHIKGKIYGPFDRRLVEKPVFNLNTWGFIDSKDETSYVIYNGKEIGIHEDPLYPVGLKVAKKSWAYVLIDQLEGTTTVVINGQEYGPYLSLHNYYLNNDGSRWAIAYSDNPEEYYILFNNGKKIGPYKRIIDFRFLGGKGGRWVLSVEMNNILPKDIQGKKVEQFVMITNNGEVGTFEQKLLRDPGFSYNALETKGANYGLNVIQNQQVYYLANDDLYGPYQQPVVAVDMGKEYNKFNYINPTTRNLHFKGDGIFSSQVKDYYVSESRKSVAVIKKASLKQDSLFLNAKYFKGVYDKIEYIKFAPESEDWGLLSNQGGNRFMLHFSNGRSFGPFYANITQGVPTLMLGKGAKNWAFFYQDATSNKTILLVNNNPRNEDFIGTIARVKEEGQEYFSWFSLDDKTVYLNKLLLE